MKNKMTIGLAALLAGLMYSTIAYGVTVSDSNASLKLQFVESENFTDIDLGYLSDEKNAEKVMESVREAFQQSADKYLPTGYELEVQVTNIDLAGDRSPMTSTFGDIRVYRDLYPPRIHFTYAIYDAQENLVASGSARETDLSYTQTFRGVGRRSDDKAPYVVDLVKSWSSKTLRKELERTAN